MSLDAAYLVADGNGAYIEGSQAALDLLGIDLDGLKARRVGDFSEAGARESVRELLSTWVSRPGTWLTGVTDLVRADGTSVRVRFAAIRRPNGELVTRFDPHSEEGEGSEPAIGDVLEAWRRQERKLAELPPGSEQYVLAEAESEWLRTEYQRLVAARTDDTAEF